MTNSTALLDAPRPGSEDFAPVRPELDSDAVRILNAALAVLAQGELLATTVSPEDYSRKSAIAFNASIGGHYRHCLDHFTSLIDGVEKREINYDHRERDARIETDPAFALKITRQLRHSLEQLPVELLHAPVLARCEVSYEKGSSPRAASTLSREVVYAIAHAVHHFALIAVMARLMEINLPAHFGVAPSTVAWQATLESSTR